MPSAKKEKEVAALTELVRGATGYYFLDFTGVAANDFNMARRQLRTAGASIRVVKNRLAFRALVESGIGEEVAEYLKGPTSVVVVREDAIVPARVLKEIARKLTALKVKGAYVEETFFDADRFDFLASLPTKDDLRGQLVGVLSAPIWELANSLEGLLNEFAYVLDQLGERRSEAQTES
ncbi:MAG TPA: 50S ribosomal protein L10 [candidate division WOR-3 bacterium]|uniref:Large ribosomal subunit protein uL10 n=1 Tax=candidate division WOR-3 bacterium TaxID=2052148 RepID=A0A7V0T5A7_UNCW3|nr:50S ribosomal protein L10 [candidate division WOR-3 bacterium]